MHTHVFPVQFLYICVLTYACIYLIYLYLYHLQHIPIYLVYYINIYTYIYTGYIYQVYTYSYADIYTWYIIYTRVCNYMYIPCTDIHTLNTYFVYLCINLLLCITLCAQVREVQEAGSIRIHFFNPWNVVEATTLASLTVAIFFRMWAFVCDGNGAKFCGELATTGSSSSVSDLNEVYLAQYFQAASAPFVLGKVLFLTQVRKTTTMTDRPTIGPTDRPTDRPTGQQTNRPIYQQTNRPTDRSTNIPTDRPTDQQIDRPTDRPTNRPTDRPAIRPLAVVLFFGQHHVALVSHRLLVPVFCSSLAVRLD